MSVTHKDTVTWNSEALDEIVSNDVGRPVLFTNARVLTMDPLIGTLRGADVLLVGALLVGSVRASSRRRGTTTPSSSTARA
jgi:hypothetical protein